mgnify:CR=1 FL=1
MKRKVYIFIIILIFTSIAHSCVNTGSKNDKDLFEVALSENWDEVERMIKNKADVNAKNEMGVTVLMIACSFEKKEIVELLIEKGADVNAESLSYETPLTMSINGGNIEITRLLINNGADVNKPNNAWNSPLMIASLLDENELIEILIENGADINVQDKVSGHTALQFICSNGNYEMVKLFIENGADADLRSHNGNTPIMLALRHNHFEIAKLLFANIDESSYTNTEKLMLYSYFGDLNKVKKLVIDKKTNPDASILGFTPLLFAIHAENIEIIDFLIKEGADSNIKNEYDGISANDLAEEKGIDLN